jgi:hypothetical protein
MMKTVRDSDKDDDSKWESLLKLLKWKKNKTK